MKQTLTIEQMQHLKELGLELKQSLVHYWRCAGEDESKWKLTSTEGDISGKNRYYDYLPAYTLNDIIEMLPKQIEDRDGYQSYIAIYHDGKMWIVSYSSEDEEYNEMGYQYHCESGIELIDAAYKMLCWCLENKYIETKEK